jgi:transposase
MHRLQELVRLHRMGVGDRETARLLGMGPNTERQYRQALAQAQLLDGDAEQVPELETLKAAVLEHAPPKLPPQQLSSVGEWRPRIEQLLDNGLGPRAIFDRLRVDHSDFKGSYASIKRLARTIRRERGVQPDELAIPVETDAGDVAQVDFGYAGQLWDPEAKALRRAWVFVMVLGYSRHMFADVVFDQKTETWLRLHVAAFKSFGGVPQTIVPDNLKAAVVRAAFAIDEDSDLNRSFRELARHYGFRVDPTPPRAPKKKGKVEASVKYVKHNALAGRAGEDVTVARAGRSRDGSSRSPAHAITARQGRSHSKRSRGRSARAFCRFPLGPTSSSSGNAAPFTATATSSSTVASTPSHGGSFASPCGRAPRQRASSSTTTTRSSLATSVAAPDGGARSTSIYPSTALRFVIDAASSGKIAPPRSAMKSPRSFA